MGVGEVVVVWRSKGDRRGWVRGLTHTRSPVIHRWCMGLIVSRRFVWEQSLLSLPQWTMQSHGHDHGLFLVMEKGGSSPLTGHSQSACHCTEHLVLFFVLLAPPAAATNIFFTPLALA